MAKKGTRGASTQVRIAVVTQALLNGFTRGSIVQDGVKRWKISERQVDEYIRKATADIEEITKSTAERTIALLTANLWELFRTHKQWRPAVARASLMDIAKLHGLDRIEVNLHVDRPLKDSSDEDLAKAILGA